MIMLSATVHLIVFRFIHLLAFIYELSIDFTNYLHYHLFKIYNEYKCITEIDRLINELKTLKKRPKHLAVLIVAEKPAIESVAKLVIWSLASDIHYLSIYDSKGYLKTRRSELEESVEKLRFNNDSIVWNDENCEFYKENSQQRKLQVRLLCRHDGRLQLGKMAIELSQCQIRDKSALDIELEEMFLRQSMHIYPTMGLCCGKTFSLDGYPPWQIRTTEFFHWRTHCYVTPEKFVNILGQYSRCQQRCGK